MRTLDFPPSKLAVRALPSSLRRILRALPHPSLLRWAIVFCLVALLAPAAALAQTLPPATQVAGQITVGWNLGNSLESLPGETGFGNPLVTQQLIDAVKRAGFNAVRIPYG